MHANQYLSGRRIAVIGAGLVGSLCALHLVRRGAIVDLFERRSDMRRADIPGGRSIAMSLSERGWHALATVGLEETVRRGTTPKTIRCVHMGAGDTQSQEYGRDGQALWTVNRKELNCILLDAAETRGVRLHFDTVCEPVATGEGTVRVTCAERGFSETMDYDHLIGADGMHSKVRGALKQAGHIDEVLTTLDYRYFELTIPGDAEGGHKLPADSVHIWPRPEGLFVALPNQGGTFTGTLFFAKDGDNLFRDDRSAEERARGFAEVFGEVAELTPDYARILQENPPSDIKAVRCSPWHDGGRTMLIGDACHAIVPFYAMGMNCGFEDCTVFDGLIEEFEGDMERVFPAFSERRKPCTDAIGDLSLRNFKSIGSSADPNYHERWLLERKIWEAFPEQWTPLYAMIHFGRRPLDEVVEVDRRQKLVLDRLLNDGIRAQADLQDRLGGSLPSLLSQVG